jgi:hypothetical protein
VIAEEFEAYPGVEEIVDQREVLNQFLRFTNVIRNAALIVAAIQLVAAGVLIANTIRVAAFARREQTSIMKLVGASTGTSGCRSCSRGDRRADRRAGLLGSAVRHGAPGRGQPLAGDRADAVHRRAGDREVVSSVLGRFLDMSRWLLGAGAASPRSPRSIPGLALRRFLDV